MSPSIRCDWEGHPDKAEQHGEHDSLATCDSWVCSCGNSPYAQGFYPVERAEGQWIETDDDVHGYWRCDRCGAIFTRNGAFVEMAPINPQGK
jgi:hypothetical protein